MSGLFLQRAAILAAKTRQIVARILRQSRHGLSRTCPLRRIKCPYPDHRGRDDPKEQKMFDFSLNAQRRLQLRRADGCALLTLCAVVLITAGVTLDAAATLLAQIAEMPR
jgi:hypothetical protein